MSDIRVRVGQQNAIKVVSSSVATYVGIAGYANNAGISSYSNYAGISSYSNYAGISSYSNYSGISSYSNYSGISSYSNYAGISTTTLNISGGVANSLVYQTSPGITNFISTGTFSQILSINIDGVPIWVNPPPFDAITGLTVINQSQIVGNANSITTLRIVGTGLSASLGVTPSVANLEIIEIDGGEY